MYLSQVVKLSVCDVQRVIHGLNEVLVLQCNQEQVQCPKENASRMVLETEIEDKCSRLYLLFGKVISPASLSLVCLK